MGRMSTVAVPSSVLLCLSNLCTSQRIMRKRNACEVTAIYSYIYIYKYKKQLQKIEKKVGMEYQKVFGCLFTRHFKLSLSGLVMMTKK